MRSQVDPGTIAIKKSSETVDAVSSPSDEEIEETISFSLRVNGRLLPIVVDPRTTLLDCLRDTLGLTGTKRGCDHGQCGACTVLVNGRRVDSCLSFAVMHTEDEIQTIEDLGTPEHLHPLQEAFLQCDGYQCGYCTAGQCQSRFKTTAICPVL